MNKITTSTTHPFIMDKLPEFSVCQMVVNAHNVCLETAVMVLNIRGAPPCVASLGKALENLAHTLRKLDFAWHLHEEPSIKPWDQDGRPAPLGTLRGCGKFYEAALNILSGHLWDTSTPNLMIFHEDQRIWQEEYVLGLTEQADSYKSEIDRELLLAL